MRTTNTLSPSIHFLRQLTAVLATASGFAQVAGLWLGNLAADTVLGALCGSAYLLIGVGLFGQSRFALFLAIALAGSMLALTLQAGTGLTNTNQLRLFVDACIIAASTYILWKQRHQSGK
ncbi:MAG: hypothetical protein ACK5ME_00650 [Parahaliea sp.]